MAFDAISIQDETGLDLECVKLDNYYLCYNLDTTKTYYDKETILEFNINILDFKLSVLSDNSKEFTKSNLLTLLTLLDKFKDLCINDYTLIPNKCQITDNIYFNRVIYKKYFSKFFIANARFLFLVSVNSVICYSVNSFNSK